MKNTLENKAKFFALYYGQEILTRDDGFRKLWKLGDEVSIESALSKHGYNYGYYLELKPLSQITNEDAIEIGKIVYEKFPDENELRMVVKEAHLGRLLMVLEETSLKYPKNVHINDYLRSKGYALPWMGISVEEQIEFGWVKLKL